MLPGLIATAGVTVALAVGHGQAGVPLRPATLEVLVAPTAAPPLAARRLGPPRAVRLTIGVSGDLLPHLPIVARAHALAGGVRHPGYVVVHAARSERASWRRTGAVVGRSRRVRPTP